MPPVAITIVIPTATSAVGATCKRMFQKLLAVAKLLVKIAFATTRRTSAAVAP
jgi:hypothetical protein